MSACDKLKLEKWYGCSTKKCIDYYKTSECKIYKKAGKCKDKRIKKNCKKTCNNCSAHKCEDPLKETKKEKKTKGKELYHSILF